jgi:hypothetical protein
MIPDPGRDLETREARQAARWEAWDALDSETVAVEAAEAFVRSLDPKSQTKYLADLGVETLAEAAPAMRAVTAKKLTLLPVPIKKVLP